MALDLVTMNSLPEAKLELVGIGAAEGEAVAHSGNPERGGR